MKRPNPRKPNRPRLDPYAPVCVWLFWVAWCVLGAVGLWLRYGG